MIGVFGAEEQQSIRQQLSMVLKSVIAQRLLPNVNGDGRVPAVEIMMVTSAVSHLIRTGKPQNIYSLIELGKREGMQTMEQSLADLVNRKLVLEGPASKLARDTDAFQSLLSSPDLSNSVSKTSNRGGGNAHFAR